MNVGPAFWLQAGAPPSGGTTFTSYTNSASGIDISQTGTLAKFNSALGTLTSAILTLSGTCAGSVVADIGASGSSVTGSVKNVTYLNFSTDLFELDELIAAGLPNVTLQFGSGTQTLAPGSHNVYPGSDAKSATIDLSSILAFLSAPGGGPILMACDSVSGISQTGGGGFMSSYGSGITASSGARIDYIYT